MSIEAPEESAHLRRAEILKEMIARRLVGPKALSWSPDQYTLLLRMRQAEKIGAFRLIRRKRGTTRGYAVEHDAGKGFKSLLLTSEGYDQFVFLLSQDARLFFEGRGATAKWVFDIATIPGKPVFDKSGMLTQEGLALYHRIRHRRPVFWKRADGSVDGTVRPTPEVIARARGEVPPEEPAGAAKGGRPGSGEAMAKVASLLREGYVELSGEELEFLLKTGKMTKAQLAADSSLEVIETELKTFHLLSPSDPLMALVSQLRSASPGKD